MRAVHLAGANSAAIVKGLVLAVGWAFPMLVLGALAGLAWVLLRRRLSQRPT